MEPKDSHQRNTVDPQGIQHEALVQGFTTVASPEGAPAEPKPARLPAEFAGYEIGPELGRGGMGVVFSAVETKLGRQVAIKVLLDSNFPNELQLRRFTNEANAAARLAHENIVPIYSVGEENGVRFFAMKLIRGIDLRELLASTRKSLGTQELLSKDSGSALDSTVAPRVDANTTSEHTNRQIDLSAEHYSASMQKKGHRSANVLARSVATIGLQVAEALEHAHEQGIIHRDIKPANLMLDEGSKVWVTDFGLARLRNSPSLTKTGDVIGTLRYMSPEQASGRRAFVDSRTDIYSLGVTLYELVTLCQACQGSSVAEILREVTFERPIPIRKHNRRLPRDLETIICRATERNPTDRYQTAAGLAADLRKFLNCESLKIRRISRWKYARDWLYARPKVMGAIAAAICIVFVALSGAVWAAVENAKFIQQQIEANAERTNEIDAQRYLYLSQRELPTNPGRAIILAQRSAEIKPSHEANQAILSALNELREQKTMYIGDGRPLNLQFVQRGARVDLFASTKESIRFIEYSVPNGRLDRSTELDVGGDASVIGFEGRLLLAREAKTTIGSSKNPASKEPVTKTRFSLWATKNLAELRGAFIGPAGAHAPTIGNFSPDGKLVVLPAVNRNAAVYSVADGSRSYFLGEHSDDVLACVFSDNGKFIATWARDGTAAIWTSDGVRVKELTYETSLPTSCRPFFLRGSNYFAITGPDGTKVDSVSPTTSSASYYPERNARASVASDSMLLRDSRLLKIIDARTGNVVNSVEMDRRVLEYALCGEDRFVASALGKSVSVVDIRTGEKVADLRGHDDTISSLVGHPSQEIFVSSSFDGTVRIWNVRSDADRCTYPSKVNRTKPFTGFSLDGKLALIGPVSDIQTTIQRKSALDQSGVKVPGELIAAIEDDRIVTYASGALTVWDTTSARSLASTVEFSSGVRAAVSLAEGQLLCLTKAGRIVVWFWKEERVSFMNELEEPVGAWAISIGRNRLYAGMRNGEVREYDLSAPFMHSLLDRFDAPIIDLSLDSSGAKMAIVTKRNSAVVYDTQNKVTIQEIATDDKLTSARLVSNGSRLLTYGTLHGKAIRLWDCSKGTMIAKQECDGLMNVTFQQNEGWCAVASLNSGAFIWDFERDAFQLITRRPTACLDISSDSQLTLATVRLANNSKGGGLESRQPTLMRWNVKRGATEEEHVLDSNLVSIVSVGPNVLVSSGRSSGVDVVELQSNQVVNRLRGHSASVLKAFFTESGSHIVSVGTDGTILEHDIKLNSREVLDTSRFLPRKAAISPDKRLLLLCDQSGLLQQWDLNSHDVVTEWENDLPLSHIQVGTDNFTVAAVVGSAKLRRWDLRTRMVTDYTFKSPVHHVQLSPDCKSMLVCYGKWPVIPAPSRRFAARENPDNDFDVCSIDLQNGERKMLRHPGRSVKAVFTNNGNNIAVLDTFGRVQVYTAKEFQPVVQPRSTDIVLGLLASDGGSQLLANVQGYVVGWESLTGTRTLRVPSRSSGKEATMDLDSWTVTQPACSWLLILSETGVRKIPKDPLVYAKTVAPRILEQSELDGIGVIPSR